jgi:hypothetical protein
MESMNDSFAETGLRETERRFAKAAAAIFLAAICSFTVAFCGAFSERKKSREEIANSETGPGPAVSAEADFSGITDTAADLEKIAEIERTGIYFPGLAIIESGLKEKAGDYTGAVIGVYKELSLAYGYGTANREQVAEGLQSALAHVNEKFHILDPLRNSASLALRACMAFAREDWVVAEELLAGIPAKEAEPDSFLRWMLLVCALENDNKGNAQAARSSYGAIRARYVSFPEYWYRGARAFSAGNLTGGDQVAAAFAEQCVNVSPKGPFTEECRKILAGHFGISPNGMGGNQKILTKAEIEDIIRGSVSGNNPNALEELFPLLALPENPSTLYALGALKALSSVPEFRTFFAEYAHKSQGRLGERLNYISRGSS